MTEQVRVADIAGMLLSEGNDPDLNETTGAADEIQDVIESQPDQPDYELEAEQDGIEEEAIEGDDSDEPEYYDVKVDGEDLQVTLEEALAGYQRDSDYRKKTMSVAESRKEVEAKAASIDAKLQELDSFIKRKEDDTDWESLRRDDPGEYLKRKEDLEAVKAATEKARNERNAELTELQQANVSTQSAKLAEVMGGDNWTQEQRNVDMKAASEYLTNIGITEAEMPTIVDHRLWRMIFDASKAQGIQQTKTKVREQVRTAPKSVRPGQKLPASERKRKAAVKQLQNAGRRNEVGALANLLNLEQVNNHGITNEYPNIIRFSRQPRRLNQQDLHGRADYDSVYWSHC